ncbi:hypothetical protein ACQCT6_04980 [Cytobacillus gottheilii]|uniref:Uncharacterized protein n=1 Tax=Cytobacillus gottheilii TaxID=859144 RepID=A0ABX8FFU0_9BACI|nr:hypothetical protein [Cytobacillus gottheilii]QVY62899.1 hypothetical protein J1899_07595 [Cytobacillus gottheilii]
MKKIQLFSILAVLIFCFFLNVLGLLKLVPLFITAPLLFASLITFISFLNNRNRFKGF